jgi:hypothetical protein
MTQFIKDRLAAIWQDRFRFGVSLNFGDLQLVRYQQGTMFTWHGPGAISVNTGHWPWVLFEVGGTTGAMPSWTIGILGFTFGMVMEHAIDEEGEVAGPDFKKYYWFFKGLNHRGQPLEEII